MSGRTPGENPRHLGATFDEVAGLYDRVRPGYPEELFDDVVELSGVPPEGRMLEIGAGTGRATVPFARRGYRILGIEPGTNLATIARRNLADYPQAEIRVGAFEDLPLEKRSFDVAYAASAFHWLDPAVALSKVARALKPGGAVALFQYRNVHTAADEGFFEAVQEVYRRFAPEMTKDWRPLPRTDAIHVTHEDDIEQSRLFGEVAVREYRWDATYDARDYTDLLNTYSDHRALDEAVRGRLLDGIAKFIDERYGGRVIKGYLTVLYVAHRKGRRLIFGR